MKVNKRKGTPIDPGWRAYREDVWHEIERLGGKRVQDPLLESSRTGKVYRSTSELQCFSRKAARVKSPYIAVFHHTVMNSCRPGCWKVAKVICIRTYKDGGRYMTTHIAGECPYCIYEEDYSL